MPLYSVDVQQAPQMDYTERYLPWHPTQNRDPTTPWPPVDVHYPNRQYDLHGIPQHPELVHINRSPLGAQVRVAY
jgi:hypothetical protein